MEQFLIYELEFFLFIYQAANNYEQGTQFVKSLSPSFSVSFHFISLCPQNLSIHEKAEKADTDFHCNPSNNSFSSNSWSSTGQFSTLHSSFLSAEEEVASNQHLSCSDHVPSSQVYFILFHAFSFSGLVRKRLIMPVCFLICSNEGIMSWICQDLNPLSVLFHGINNMKIETDLI